MYEYCVCIIVVLFFSLYVCMNIFFFPSTPVGDKTAAIQRLGSGGSSVGAGAASVVLPFLFLVVQTVVVLLQVGNGAWRTSYDAT